MRVVALDLSLTCTGVADSALEAPYVIRPPDALRKVHPMARLRWIQQKVEEATRGADLVVIEGYSYGSGYQAHQLGELGGAVRLTLYVGARIYVDVPPPVRMKIATGSGQAKKERVLAAAIHRLGYLGSSNDEADALWLLELARHHYGLPGRTDLPAAHLEPLARASVAWPSAEDVIARKAS